MDIPSAQSMREVALLVNKEDVVKKEEQRQLSNVISEIRYASDKGETSVLVFRLSKSNKTQLELLGYNVTSDKTDFDVVSW